VAVDVDTTGGELTNADQCVTAATEDAVGDPDTETGSGDLPQSDDGLLASPKRRRSLILIAAGITVVAIAVLAGLAGRFEYQARHERRAAEHVAALLQAGRQAALNLTTIDYNEADADITRVLDSATGEFKDEFQRNSAGFADVVRKAQATTVGTVTAAGVESTDGDSAQILVALSVKTTNAGAPEQQPRLWRMRITMQKQGDDAMVSNVRFVP
jgi:Mce-associated membrane protein